MDLGANIEDRSNNGKTPLLWASLWGHLETVKLLVKRGADIDSQDRVGLTPLMSATLKNHLEIVNYLISMKVNVTIPNYYNGTALSIAESQGNKEMIELLKPLFPVKESDISPYFFLFELSILKSSQISCKAKSYISYVLNSIFWNFFHFSDFY